MNVVILYLANQIARPPIKIETNSNIRCVSVTVLRSWGRGRHRKFHSPQKQPYEWYQKGDKGRRTTLRSAQSPKGIRWHRLISLKSWKWQITAADKLEQNQRDAPTCTAKIMNYRSGFMSVPLSFPTVFFLFFALNALQIQESSSD